MDKTVKIRTLPDDAKSNVPQNNLTEDQNTILELVKNILIKDKDYMERVKRHYNMFKADIDKRSEIKEK